MAVDRPQLGHLGKLVKTHYDELVAEPLPPRLAGLVERLKGELPSAQAQDKEELSPGQTSDAATGTNGAIFRLDNVVFCAVSMFAHLPRIGLVVLFLSVAAGHAEPPSRVDLEAAEMTAELIGAPVFAKDGVEVGAVADIALDEGLQPQRLRMTTGKTLGFGVRTLDVPKGAFMLMRGAVILDVPSEAVSAFAELVEPTDEK